MLKLTPKYCGNHLEYEYFNWMATYWVVIIPSKIQMWFIYYYHKPSEKGLNRVKVVSSHQTQQYKKPWTRWNYELFWLQTWENDGNWNFSEPSKIELTTTLLTLQKVNEVLYEDTYRRFWNQVFTCVSLIPNLLASSMRSCTLKYFWRLKHFSMLCNWWSVNAVRALRCFLCANRSADVRPRFESFKSSSSLPSDIVVFASSKLFLLSMWFFVVNLVLDDS